MATTQARSAPNKQHIRDMEIAMKRLCEKHSEKPEILVRIGSFAPRVGVPQHTLRRNGFPGYFDYIFNSCSWEYRIGLSVNPEQFLEELERIESDRHDRREDT